MSKTQTNKILENYADHIKRATPDFEYFGPESNIKDLARSLNQFGNNSLLLTGPAGIGRRSLISGFVQNLDADFMPIEMMNTNVYRLNVQELFNTQNIANVENKFDEVLEELKSIKARTGSKPVLVIDDGTCFAREVSERKASSLLNKLKAADIDADDFDVILSLDTDALLLMNKNYKNFLAHFAKKEVETLEDNYVIDMLKHEAQRYEDRQLSISEDAIEKVLELCKRYPALGDFSMPKNASVFMDEVATAYRLKMHSKPEGVIDNEAQLAELQEKLANGSEDDATRVQSDIEQLEACIKQSNADWDQAKEKIKKIKSDISEAEQATAKQQEKLDKYEQEFLAKSALSYEKLTQASDDRVKDMTLETFIATDALNKNESMDGGAAKTRRNIEDNNSWVKDQNVELLKAIKEMAFPITLTAEFADQYAKVKLGMDDSADIRKLICTAEEKINGIVMGQEQMVNPLINSIRQRLFRKSEMNKPTGVFLIVGPSGVGKTYIAEVLAEELCDGKISKVPMVNFQEQHTVSTIIGAPPGYAGYEQEAQLTTISKKNPNGIILLDEIEKAHLKVKQALIDLLGTGDFLAANGKDRSDFRDNIFIMTSNFGQQEIILPQADEPYETWSEQLKEDIFKAQKDFSPEFLNRCTIVCADFLGEDVIRKVVAKRVKSFAAEFVGEDEDFSVTMDETSINSFVTDHYKKKNGARTVQDMLSQEIGGHISSMVQDDYMNDKNTCGHLEVCYKDGAFTYTLNETTVSLSADNENNAQNTVTATQAASTAFAAPEKMGMN